MIATQLRTRTQMPASAFALHRSRYGGQMLAAAGSLRVVLATDASAVRAGQRLRHEIFFGHADALAAFDADAYDDACQHLLLIDDAAGGRAGDAAVVATCRLLHQADAGGMGFYSAQEFNLDGLLLAHAGLPAMEVGRLCIREGYRHRRAVDLLWRAVWIAAQRRRAGLLFGCASLPGTDPAALAPQLAFVQQVAAAPASWKLRVREACAISTLPGIIAPAGGLADLPPLLKTYLRLGAFVADGAAVDPHFCTTDVFVALRLADIGRRYVGHFMT